jgi:putative transposase
MGYRLLHTRDRRLRGQPALPRKGAITVIERVVAEQGILPGTLILDTDNGSAFTARATRTVLSGLGVGRFIESWFSKLRERLIWRMEFETLEQLRVELAAYVNRYHHRPHSGMDYRTPKEVRHTWDDAQQQPLKLAV